MTIDPPLEAVLGALAALEVVAINVLLARFLESITLLALHGGCWNLVARRSSALHGSEVVGMSWRLSPWHGSCCRHGMVWRLSLWHGPQVVGIAWLGGCWHGMEVVAISWPVRGLCWHGLLLGVTCCVVTWLVWLGLALRLILSKLCP